MMFYITEIDTIQTYDISTLLWNIVFVRMIFAENVLRSETYMSLS